MPIRHIFAVTLMVLLSACVASSGADKASELDADVGTALEPDLVLNMPTDAVDPCVAGEAVETTLLDLGFSSLVAGRHVEAVTYFQRYRDRVGTPAANWEADVAIAYDSMIPASPFYDPAAASKSYARLSGSQPQAERVHEKVLMMRDSLATFAGMQARIGILRRVNSELDENLQKREEAIKRLRELTLGQ